MENVICFSTQRYDVPSGRVRKRFVFTLMVEFHVIWNLKWNTGRLINFQTVIFQRVRLVTGAKNVRGQINSHLDSWIKGNHNELVQDSYSAVSAYLGKSRGTQKREQHHCTFSNLILRGELRKSVKFICEQDTGGVLLPKNWATGKTGVLDTTIAEVLAGKISAREKIPLFYVGGIDGNYLFSVTTK